VGRRLGFGREMFFPHSTVLCMIGTGMLWVGWYGFNAGSALGSDGIAANAFMATTLAAAVGSFTWGMLELVVKRQPSVLGFCSGAVGGLVVVTPAAGYVDANGAVLIGILAGAIPFVFCLKLKKAFGYDDALDTFGIHAVGGTLGSILTGLLATASVNPNLSAANPIAKANGLAELVATRSLWREQVMAAGVTIILAIVATSIIALLLKASIGLRPTTEVERQGLDVTEHGEEGYVG
jgi:ammonium transporter, Amt family